MYQKIRRLLLHTLIPAVLAVFLLPFSMHPATVFAQEAAVSVILPVNLQVTGNRIPDGLEYHLVLEGKDQAPVPENCEIIVKNGGTASFGPIIYTELENYSYQVYQKAGENSRVAYDNSVYVVTVQVINDGNGGLKANVLASKENSSDKSGTITFTNQYTAPSGGGNGGGGRDDDGNGGNHSGGGNSGGSQTVDPQPSVNPGEEAGLSDMPSPAEQAENLPLPISLLPKTGDGSVSSVLLLVILAASGILIFWLTKKRREKDAE
ncbi:MAG: FctA domain-containing protein [Lachnospiraceae bacterium]|nr:FctA domain-containing protein [Lachnospiraceae bacterium]